MKLSSRLRVSLRKRQGQVVLRSELTRMASPSQLSAGLNQLVGQGWLIRLSEGLYAKSQPGEDGRGHLQAPPADLLREAFAKLGIQINGVQQDTEQDRPVLWVDVGSRRIERKVDIDGVEVRYLRHAMQDGMCPSLPANPDDLPTTGVQSFIERYARAHRVHPVRTGLDDYAEAVTRAAGDDVTLDPVGKLLVALKKKGLLNGAQLARLMTNYMRETKGVRSLRRLPERGLSTQH